MNTPNFPSDASHDQPVDPGDLKISPETLLSPEQMVALAIELLRGIEVDFPEIGEIPVVMNTKKNGEPKDGFEFGLSAKNLYTPGLGSRPFFDPTERTGKDDPRQKDFATWFVQCFGKTITVRIRNSSDLPEPADLRHVEVPKLVRTVLDPRTDNERRTQLLDVDLANIVSHNIGLPLKDNVEVNRAHEAQVWLINKLSAMMAPAEAA